MNPSQFVPRVVFLLVLSCTPSPAADNDARDCPNGKDAGDVRSPIDGPSCHCLRVGNYTDFIWIPSAVFSPDGQLVIAGVGDAAVVWNAETTDIIQKMGGHGGHVLFAALSPNGARAVTSSEDGSIRLWDVRSGRQLLRMESNSLDSRELRFSEDGELVAATSFRSVYVWNADTGKLVRRFDDWAGGTGTYWSVFFSTGGKAVNAIATNDRPGKFWRRWNIDTGKCVSPQLDNLPKNVSRAKIDDSSTRIVVGGQSVVAAYDIDSGKSLARFDLPDAVNGFDIAVSRCGTRMAHGSRRIRVWDVASREQMFEVDTKYSTDSINFSPDGDVLISGARDGSVRLWTLATPE